MASSDDDRWVLSGGQSCAALAPGGTRWVYLIGSFFEVVLLLLAARTAWRWPTTDHPVR